MAFKRRASRPRARRRRTRWEQDRIVECNFRHEVARNAICCPTAPAAPNTQIDVIPLLTMTIPFTASPERYPSTMTTRRMIFGGMKFQSDWWTNPQEWAGDDNCTVNFATLTFILKIWEAIVVLPLQEGSTFVPDYLPSLACALLQGEDEADRVLWKRVTMLPMWGTQFPVSLPQLEFTNRNTESGFQVVKGRAAVDDRHGIYLVRQFVHDVFFEPPGGPDDGCSIPVFNELWGTMFYRAQGS